MTTSHRSSGSLPKKAREKDDRKGNRVHRSQATNRASGGRHGVRLLSVAARIVSRFRMQAVSAIFFGVE
jgi:hypothetical protein